MGKSSTKSAAKIDPTLASLFETSVSPLLAAAGAGAGFGRARWLLSSAAQLGSVKAPEPKPQVKVSRKKKDEEEDEDEEGSGSGEDDSDDGEGDDEELSEIDEDIESDDDDKEDSEEVAEPSAEKSDVVTDRSRKRKRKAAEEDIEDSYMRKLQDDEPKPKTKKAKGKKTEDKEAGAESASDDDEEEPAKPVGFEIKHESLINPADVEIDKSNRTVFLGNVPSNAISSKTDYKTLKAFFATAGKISSVRFRSVAFSEQIPRKAAFVNHKLHEKQKTVNAYIVYKDAAGARKALTLNGSVVLDRHIRVDSVAHPAKQDHKRCVFVGNLDFEAQEENLWRHFGPCGKVEYARVVRDSKTNVGKGFAYIQFEDAMSVDQALLLDGKKMEGDRKLRVTPAKAQKRNAKEKHNDRDRQRRPPPKAGSAKGYVPRTDPKQAATIGRATKLLGKAGAVQLRKHVDVFEGMRATATSDSGIKKGGTGKKKGGKARARTTVRSTAWKKKSE
ncbi:hypothetical protein BZA05DRAFT_339357 [Tricharina praecox]|uniref:uncharacterized protein n=1 Tax=Tricharina praecox TaxID=43433 RepID=UPI002221169B|nr:uncharacterized protein BZA05DRAFT_339357 [Tricharina praecox]KAI5848992.1 hypothetical protein BZA05DRAFT_339357 [Tricharina praecox]